jgi:hypothetical protein
MDRTVNSMAVTTPVKQIYTCTLVPFILLTSLFQDGIYPDNKTGGFDRASRKWRRNAYLHDYS